MPVTPGATYTFCTWINGPRRASLTAASACGLGELGSTILGEARFGATPDYTHHEVTVTVPAGVSAVTVYAGFEAPGVDTWIQVDDVTVG